MLRSKHDTSCTKKINNLTSNRSKILKNKKELNEIIKKEEVSRKVYKFLIYREK